MAGTIIADFIRTDANQLSLNVGNTTFATINSSGFFSNTGTRIIAANGTVATSALSGTISTAQIANSAVTSDKISSIANTTITTGLGYIPPNPGIKGDMRFSNTTPKVHQGLMFYITGGTISASQVPFYASSLAQAESLAPYAVISFMNYIKNLENDSQFDQLYNSTLYNSTIFNYFPTGLSTTGIDVDENFGTLASTSYLTSDFFRVIVASNGVDKLWTTSVIKGISTDNGSVTQFQYQVTSGETGVPSLAGLLSTLPNGSAMKCTEAASITGSSGSIGIVLPIPLTVALNF
jgi:hypothetical protein